MMVFQVAESKRLVQRSSAVVCATLLIFAVLSGEGIAATYYISPTGSDSNSGTSSNSPWRTFAFAIPLLKPGDTLILKDGTYTGSNSGFPVITSMSGTASNPITIKAEHERLAWLKGNGSQSTLRLTNSSYFEIEGLRISMADNPSAARGVGIVDSSHVTLRRLLVHNNNRYFNSHLINLKRTTNSLIEDTELFYFHRHGIAITASHNNVVRRLYCNSRDFADINGGYASGNKTGGEMCVTIYPGSNNIVENLISDGNQTAFDIQATSTSDKNAFLGIISLNGNYGGVIKARGSTDAKMPHDTIVKNFVVINASKPGLYSRSAKGTRCDNCSFWDGSMNGLLADKDTSYPGDGNYSIFSDNSLAVNNAKTGFRVTNDVATWTIDTPNAYSNSTNYSPSSSPNLINNSENDPQVGSCKVYIPDGSSMKNAGKNGKDIGANVLYRYENGVLTGQRLWDAGTGKFPCGAIVGGVNDIPGTSCFDVHTRLDVNTTGCPFPAAYAQGDPDFGPPAAPGNLRILP